MRLTSFQLDCTHCLCQLIGIKDALYLVEANEAASDKDQVRDAEKVKRSRIVVRGCEKSQQ